jgi:DNA polymerase-3 subunit beta
LGGVKIDFYADGMVAAATDSRKLVKYKDLTVTHNGVEQSVLGYVLRRKTCTLLANVFQTVTDDEMVEIYFNTSVVRMHCGNNFITSRLVEGTYPNYDSVIPLNNNIVVELDRNTILNAIKRVMPMGNNETDLVILDFKESMLTICAEDLDYGTSATENIPCEYAYEPLKIGLKGRSLLQTLQNVDGENVRMMFRNPQSAVVVTPSDTNGNIEHLSLLMPMKLS